MSQKIFSIRDTKAGENGKYGKPIMAETSKEVIRELSVLVNEKNGSLISQFPVDYDLFELGSYDLDSGKIVAHATPHHIIKLDSLKV